VMRQAREPWRRFSAAIQPGSPTAGAAASTGRAPVTRAIASRWAPVKAGGRAVTLDVQPGGRQHQRDDHGHDQEPPRAPAWHLPPMPMPFQARILTRIVTNAPKGLFVLAASFVAAAPTGNATAAGPRWRPPRDGVGDVTC
jgi:hypothetical protein